MTDHSTTFVGRHIGRDPDASFNRREHRARITRLRKAGVLGLIAWPLFFAVDAFVVAFVHPGRLWLYGLLRLIGLAVLAASYLRLRFGHEPSPLVVRTIDLGVSTMLAALISLSCLEFKGFESPLALGVLTVLFARGAVLPDHYLRSLLPTSLTALAYPLTLLGLAPFSPLLSRQLREPAAVSTFVLYCLFLIAAVALVLVGGHIVWGYRRQLFRARSLGRYRLLEPIGRGGMGEVWRAHHQGLRCDVAVKVLRPDRELDENVFARFQREARLTSELKHPNTVRVFDYGTTDDGLVYYVMELLEGENLRQLVERTGPVDPRRAARIVLQGARALAEAHEQGLIHRDIKPENLFLTQVSTDEERDFVKVLDFGLVRQTEMDGELTQEGFAVGTPAFLAPEIIQGGEADGRSDVFAIGTVLYFLLVGDTPYGRSDARTVMKANIREPAALPSVRLGRALPVMLEQIVMKCLRKSPEERYADAGELARELSEWLDRPRILKPQKNERVDLAPSDLDIDPARASDYDSERNRPRDVQTDGLRRVGDTLIGASRPVENPPHIDPPTHILEVDVRLGESIRAFGELTDPSIDARPLPVESTHIGVHPLSNAFLPTRELPPAAHSLLPGSPPADPNARLAPNSARVAVIAPGSNERLGRIAGAGRQNDKPLRNDTPDKAKARREPKAPYEPDAKAEPNATREPKLETREPKAGMREPKAGMREPKAGMREPKAPRNLSREEGRKQREASPEPSRLPRSEGRTSSARPERAGAAPKRSGNRSESSGRPASKLPSKGRALNQLGPSEPPPSKLPPKVRARKLGPSAPPSGKLPPKVRAAHKLGPSERATSERAQHKLATNERAPHKRPSIKRAPDERATNERAAPADGASGLIPRMRLGATGPGTLPRTTPRGLEPMPEDMPGSWPVDESGVSPLPRGGDAGRGSTPASPGEAGRGRSMHPLHRTQVQLPNPVSREGSGSTPVAGAEPVRRRRDETPRRVAKPVLDFGGATAAATQLDPWSDETMVDGEPPSFE